MTEPVRLDKWLWAARFFRTRRLATDAANGGKITVNGERAKPARAIHVGDRLEIHRGPFRYHITVTALSAKRGAASVASGLYQENDESQQERNTLRETLRARAQQVLYDPGRPSGRDRRVLRRMKRRQGDN